MPAWCWRRCTCNCPCRTPPPGESSAGSELVLDRFVRSRRRACCRSLSSGYCDTRTRTAAASGSGTQIEEEWYRLTSSMRFNARGFFPPRRHKSDGRDRAGLPPHPVTFVMRISFGGQRVFCAGRNRGAPAPGVILSSRSCRAFARVRLSFIFRQIF